MEKKVDIANKVYKKIYFHCLKYLTEDVIGNKRTSAMVAGN